jgi:NAD(P)-dependent dehydrogenase (short-subunit alcohol dehydrogenase family)
LGSRSSPPSCAASRPGRAPDSASARCSSSRGRSWAGAGHWSAGQGLSATALFCAGKDEATVARIAAQPPLERLGIPEDIAEVVAFLAGPGRWVNGQVVYVNGGAA